MSRILVDQIRSNSASADAITLDGSGNLTIPGNITCNGNASVSGTATGFGGGKVLQVVTATTSTQHSNSTTTWADTGLSASITPASTSSKILILLSQCFHTASSQSDTGCGIRVRRDSTTIDADSDTRPMYLHVNTAGSLHIGTNYGHHILDSPSTTSSITYKTQDRMYYGTHTIVTQTGNRPSYITLIEIGA